MTSKSWIVPQFKLNELWNFKLLQSMQKPIKSRLIVLKFCTQVTFDITDLVQLSESESDPDIKKFTPRSNFSKIIQISNFRKMTPKWPTDHPIHFRTRSQYQNHHTELFSDSESQTDINNIELHLNPDLWNFSKMPTSTMGAETLSSHPKLDPKIHPSPKLSYEPVRTFKSRFRDRSLKSQSLVKLF